MSQLDETQVELQPRRSFAGWFLRPKVGIPLVLLLLLLLSPFIIRGYFLSGVPLIEEPVDRAALEAGVVPDDENAFVYYRRAAELCRHVRVVDEQPNTAVHLARENVNKHGWSWATPELSQFLDRSEEQFTILREGSKLDRAQNLNPIERHYDSILPGITEIQDLVHSGIALTHRLEAEGEAQAAGDWIVALLRLSRHIGADGGIIERHVGREAADHLVNRLNHWSANLSLSAGNLRETLQEYEAMMKLTAKNSISFQMEYLTLTQSETLPFDFGTGPADGDAISYLSSNSFLRYLRGEPELSRRLFRIYHHNLNSFVDLPPYLRPEKIGEMRLSSESSAWTFDGERYDVAEFDAAVSMSLFFQLHANYYPSWLQILDEDALRLQLGRISLAAQIFFRTRKRFPRQLKELVPEILSELPTDPFSGKPFRLSQNSEGSVVYSVFKNTTDDGGVEFRFDQIGELHRSTPNDFGVQLIEPGSIPLVAPKPFIPLAEEN